MDERTAAHPDRAIRLESGPIAIPSAVPAARPWADPSERFVRALPGSLGREFCRRHLIIGSADERGADVLRVAEGAPPWIAGNVAVELALLEFDAGSDGAMGPQLPVVLDSREEIARTIDRCYPENTSGDENHGAAHGAEDSMGEASVQAAAAQVLKDADQDLLHIEGKGPVIRLVDMILFDALSRGASDVHVQPLSDRTLVRFRVDGVLHDVRELPAVLAGAVISRIKIMSKMDVAEHGSPQDGRATVNIGGGNAARGMTARGIDLRVSTLPTAYGERAVIRLLDTSKDLHLIDLAKVGMRSDMQEVLIGRLNRAHGIVLVTGPTGSGKTTTLYAALRLIAAPVAGSLSGEHNIMTIEDPIEYELSTAGIAVSQTQTNPKKGLTFATGLRHILRQDPDVVMVGEIRDEETARMAMQASLTGHLVLSTLHTNDAATAVTRLVDLGIEPFLVSASLSAVLAQRLVRKVHTTCKGAGCDVCLRSGYSGRIGVFELLVITDHLRELIGRGGGERDIREAARHGVGAGGGGDGGMRTLMDEGRRLVESGVTTQVEVERVIQGLGT